MTDVYDYLNGVLKPHQETAVKWLRSHPRALLADACGLGKTVEAIGLICSLLASQEIELERDYVVWLTSANLLDQTRSELNQFAPILNVLASDDPLFKESLTPKARTQYNFLFGTHPDVVLLSHETAAQLGTNLWARFGEPALMVIDEASALKNQDGVKHKAVRDMTTNVPRILAMTATPHENDATETYALLRLLQLPDLWPREEFERRFITWSDGYKAGGYPVAPRPNGLVLSALPELRTYLHRHMLRRTPESIGLTLPQQIAPTIRWIPLSQPQRRAYELAAKIRGAVGHSKRTQVSRLKDNSSGLVDSFMRSLDTEFAHEKVIVGCESLSVVNDLRERLSERGIGHRTVEGSIKPAARAKAVEDFRTNPDVRVLVASRVLELGWNLQCARVLVSLDSSDNPQRETQREGRIRRIGSPHQTYVHLTLMPDTPTARKKMASLGTKRRNADLLLAPLANA